jgi:hypothetical protein
VLNKVGGDFSVPLPELHDGWWNVIGKAMA